MVHRTRRSWRCLLVLASVAVPVVAMSATADTTPTPDPHALHVKPTADCTLPGGRNGLLAYFGYDNPNPQRVTIQHVTSVFVSPSVSQTVATNWFNLRRQTNKGPTTFAPGRHPGVVTLDMAPDQVVTWRLATIYGDIVGLLHPVVVVPHTASASAATKRCLPNMVVSITRPVTVGRPAPVIVAVKNNGYPDISPGLQAAIGTPVSSIHTRLTSLDQTLSPDASSVPSDGRLMPGDVLIYTLDPALGCTTGNLEVTTALTDGSDYRAADNVATTAVGPGDGCHQNLALGLIPDVGVAIPGSTVNWTVPVTNTGGSAVRVEDIHLVSPELGQLAPAPGTPAGGLLAPGQRIDFIASAVVGDAQCGTLSAHVSVSLGSDTTPDVARDVNPADDSASADVKVACPEIQVPSDGSPAQPQLVWGRP